MYKKYSTDDLGTLTASLNSSTHPVLAQAHIIS